MTEEYLLKCLVSQSKLIHTKGQLISKCLIGSIVSTKKTTKFLKNFGPRGQIKKIKALYYTN